jgi:hypothetical protein
MIISNKLQLYKNNKHNFFLNSLKFRGGGVQPPKNPTSIFLLDIHRVPDVIKKILQNNRSFS